ncbi:MAG: hypothetical protein AB7N80_01550 [Bdellovibrionales bacterium]
MPVLRTKKHPSLLLMYLPLAVVVSFALYFSLKWGLKPKPIPQVNPTLFEMPEQIGAVVYRRLRPALRQEKMVVLGSAPWLKNYELIWNGFIGAARADNWKIDLLYEDPTLRPIKEFSGLERKALNWPNPDIALANELKQHLQFRHLIIIHTTFNHAAHRGENSLTKELEATMHRPWTAISMLGFGVDENEITNLQPKCEDEIAPATRNDYVACAATRISRRFLRKHLAADKIWAAMDRHGLKDYFLYVHEPVEPAGLGPILAEPETAR